MTDLVRVLIFVLVAALVLAIVWFVVGSLALPEPLGTIVLAVAGLLLLLVAVKQLGGPIP